MSQYYTVQHASPKHLHRFYSDTSTLTFGDVRPEGFYSKNATGQKARACQPMVWNWVPACRNLAGVIGLPLGCRHPVFISTGRWLCPPSSCPTVYPPSRSSHAVLTVAAAALPALPACPADHP